MDTDTVRQTSLVADGSNPSKKGNADILLALESGELTFVEAMRGAVDKMQTDAASLADIRYQSERTMRADPATQPEKRSYDKPRDRDDGRVDDAGRTVDRPESKAEAPERDSGTNRRDDRRDADDARAQSSRDDSRPEATSAADRRSDDHAKTTPSNEPSKKTDQAASTDNQAQNANTPTTGAEAAAAAQAAPTNHGATTAVAQTMGQWSEMVLTELLGIVQNTATPTTAAPTDTGDIVDLVGREHSAEGLANALAAVTRPVATRKGDGASNHRNGEPSSQINALALGQALGDGEVDAADQGMGRIAQQQAALSRVVGPDNQLAVQVEVTDEASTLLSRPTSSLSAPGALAGDASTSSATAADARGPNGSPIGTNPAVVAQLNAQSAATSTTTAGQTASSSAAAAIDAKAAVQAPTANHALGSNQASGGEAQAPSQANATNQTAASHAAAEAKATAQTAKPAPFSQAVIDQVSVHITRAAASGTDRIDIQLRPEHLGRIDVRLDMGTDGRVSAIITADNRDTLDLLQRDARNLERSLQDAGLNADLGSLSFNLREQNADGSQRGSGEPAGEPEVIVDEPVVEDRPTQIDVGLGLGAGRVDIRV